MFNASSGVWIYDGGEARTPLVRMESKRFLDGKMAKLAKLDKDKGEKMENTEMHAKTSLGSVVRTVFRCII